MCFCRLYRIALPATPSHSHPRPATLTHPHPFFKKNNPLPPIFWQKWHTTTHFLTKTIHSHPIFKKTDPFLPIFRQKRPPPTHFWWKTTHSHQDSTKSTQSYPFFNKLDPLPLIFQQIRPTPTILILFSTNLPPKQLVFTSFLTITDLPSPLPLKH